MIGPELAEKIKGAIRDIPDYPKKGIIFKDITPLLADGPLFKSVIDTFAMHFKTDRIDKIVGIESRGFIFGAPLATRLGVGFVPVRKKGKLPAKTRSVTYALEYGEDTLEMHADAIAAGERVLVVDDLLATGGTAQATCQLIEETGGSVVGFSCIIELGFLGGIKKLHKYPVVALIKY